MTPKPTALRKLFHKRQGVQDAIRKAIAGKYPPGSKWEFFDPQTRVRMAVIVDRQHANVAEVLLVYLSGTAPAKAFQVHVTRLTPATGGKP